MTSVANRFEAMLAAAGIAVDAAALRIEARDDRWLAVLPGELLAWLPANEVGGQRLEVERRVLDLVGQRCRFAVPRVLFRSEQGGDVRRMVPGSADPSRLLRLLGTDGEKCRAAGRWLGHMLAEQHQSIGAGDVEPWLRRRVTWPEPSAWMEARLPRVVDAPDLLTRARAAIARYEREAPADEDRVLVHGDLGLHNIAFEADTGAINGVFDYDGAAWDDRHHDFRYLIFELGRTELLDAAIETYEIVTGREIVRSRVALLNAVSAICFLANRCGVAAETRWCGRTLAEDLAWVEASLAAIA